MDATARQRDVSVQAWTLWLLALMAVGTALRMWNLGTQSLWLDEAQFLHAAVQPSMKDLLRFLVEQDFHPPVYPVMLRYWVRVAGASDLSVRMLPLLAGIALIPATALLGRLLAGRRDAGLLAAAVITLNGYHLYLSQEGRHYTWLALIGVLNMHAFIRLMSNGSRWTVPFVITCLVGLFSHYHMAFVMAGEALLAVLRRRTALVAAIAACFAVFFAAWGAELGVQLHRRSLWGEGLIDPGTSVVSGAGVVLSNLGWTGLDFSTGSYLRLVGDAGFDAADLFKLAVLAAVAWCAVRGAAHMLRNPHSKTPTVGVLICLGALPLAGAIASGFLQANVYETKYVSFVAPLWAVILGTGCRRVLSGRGGRAAVMLLGGGLLASVAHYHIEAMPWKEDWRQAAAILRRGWQPGDLLLQRAPYTQFSLRHYLDFEPGRLRSGTAREPHAAMADSVRDEARSRGARRLWVVLSHDEHVLETLRVLGLKMPQQETWSLQGIRITRFGVAPP